jgi:hypothetical protein
MAIAVDLDGTLVEYHGWQGDEHIGDVIPKMMNRVKQWVAEGKEVVIFTARVSEGGDDGALAAHHIRNFLSGHGLGALEITAIKQKKFKEFWDDRAVQIVHNTGETIVEVLRGDD